MAEEVTANTTESEEADDNVVTLQEVIQSQQALIADANAVLGASDDKNCTYSQGYINRQALYACLTCIPEAKTDISKVAGVCFACCLHCHDGHELVELYTKRNFRCDCGNSKFPNFTCKLDDTKSDTNALNTYNQNFMGVYCTCKRPYPDEEDPVNDVMIQCIICEDWYHTRHLGAEVPGNSYAEMICEGCVKQHKFLLHYDGLCLKKVDADTTNEPIEVGENATDSADISTLPHDENITALIDKTQENELAATTCYDNEPIEVGENATDSADVSTLPQDENITAMIDKTQENELAAIISCKMPKIKSEIVSAKFWPDVSWRQQLCTCVKCLKIYEDEKVLFLIDPQDTVQLYEEKGTARALEDDHKKEEKLLNSLDRVPLMETIAAYNELKDQLGEFLKKFAENKKVVREEDIKEFFEGMKARKRMKTEVPHYCR